MSSIPASDTAGVNRGPLIYDVMPSAKKTDINMMEHTAQKSAAQSHDACAPKHLTMEKRRRQVQSLERSSIYESTHFVPSRPSNVSANRALVDLSEGHVAGFSEARKPGKSADYHAYGGGNGSRNRHGSSAKDIASNTCGHGWEEHYTVDSLPVVTDTHQDQSFPRNSSQQVHVSTADGMLNSSDYEIQHSRRELSAQLAKQLQEEDRGVFQQKAKSVAKLDELSRCSFVQSRQSDDAPIEADKIRRKKAGGSGTTKHDTSTSDTCCIVYVENLIVPVTENGVKNTTVSINSTPASETAGVNGGPFICNAMPSAKNIEINMMERISQKNAAVL